MSAKAANPKPEGAIRTRAPAAPPMRRGDGRFEHLYRDYQWECCKRCGK